MAKKPKLPKKFNNKKNKDEKKLKIPKEREKKSGFLKNVFKSVRYSVHDIRSELTPNINSAIESGKEAISEMYSIGKDDFKFDIKDLKNNEIVKTSKDLIKNMFSDLKSGKFYNKERAEQGELDAAGNFGIDIDMSIFDDDDDDFDFGDDESSESSSDDDFDFGDDESSESSSGDTNIDNSKNFNTTNHNNFVTIQSNESSTVQALGVVSKSQIESSVAGFSAVSGILNNIYNFQQQNTLKFYNEMSEKMATITNALTGLNQMKEASNKMEAIKEKEDKAGELLSIVGDFSFNYYTTQLKKKMEENDAKSIMEQITGVLKVVGSNPLGYVLKGAVNTLIPKDIKNLLTETDNFVGNLPLILDRTMKIFSKKGGILGKLGSAFTKLFGLDIKANTKLDLSTDNKTEPFDTYTKKAITEVIPSYLSKIYSAISGQEEMVFNYQKGHFMTQKEIRKGFEQKVSNIPLENNDIKEVLKKLQESYFSSEQAKDFTDEDRQRIIEEVRNIVQNSLVSNEQLSTLISNNQLSQFASTKTITDENGNEKKVASDDAEKAIELLRGIFSTEHGLNNKLDKGIVKSKIDINKTMQEAAYDPTVAAAFNGRSELVKYYDPKDDKKKDKPNFQKKVSEKLGFDGKKTSQDYLDEADIKADSDKWYDRALGRVYRVVGTAKKGTEKVSEVVSPKLQGISNGLYNLERNISYENANGVDNLINSGKRVSESVKNVREKASGNSDFAKGLEIYSQIFKEKGEVTEEELVTKLKEAGVRNNQNIAKEVIETFKELQSSGEDFRNNAKVLISSQKFEYGEDKSVAGSSSLSEGIQSNYKRKNESSKTLGFIDYLSYFKEQEEKQGIGVFIKSFDKGFFDKNFINVISKNEASIRDNGDETYSGKYRSNGKKITFQNAPKYDPENPNSEAQYTVEDNGDGTFTLHLKNGETIKGRAYAEGSELINENQLALIHKGESVLTENETSTIVNLGTEVAIINDKMDFLSQILTAVTSIRSDLIKWFNGEIPDGSSDDNPTLDSLDSSTKHTGIFSKIKSKFKVAGSKIKKFFTSKFKKKNNIKEEMAEEDAENAEAAAKAKEASDKADERNKTKFAKYTEKFAEMMKDLKEGNFFKKLTESGGKLAGALEGIKNIGSGLKDGTIAAKNFLIGKKNEDGTYKDGILTKAGKGLFGSKNADGSKKQGLLSKIARGDKTKDKERGGKGGIVGAFGKAKKGLLGENDKKQGLLSKIVRGDKSKDKERGGKGGIVGAFGKAKKGLLGEKDKDGNKIKEGALGKAKKTLFGKKDKDGKNGVVTKAVTKVKDSKIGKKIFGDKATGSKGLVGKAKDKISGLLGKKKDKGMDLSFIPSGVTPVWIVGSGTKAKSSPTDGAADAAKEKANEAKEKAKEKAAENKVKLKERAKDIAHKAKVRGMELAHKTKELAVKAAYTTKEIALKVAHTTKEFALDTAHKAKERVKDAISNLKQRLTREGAVATEAGIEITETVTREQKKTGIALLAEKMKGMIGKFAEVLGNVVGFIGKGIGSVVDLVGKIPKIGTPLALGIGAAGVGIIAALSAAMVSKVSSIDYSSDEFKGGDTGGGGDIGGDIGGASSETDKAAKNSDKQVKEYEKNKEKELNKEFEDDKQVKSTSTGTSTAEPSSKKDNSDSAKENSEYVDKAKKGQLDNEDSAKMLENIINMTPFGMAHNLGKVYNKFMSSDAGKQLKKNPKEFSKNMFALSTAGMLFNGFGGNYETGSKSLKSFFGAMGRKVNETFKELGDNIKKLLGKNGENDDTENLSDSEIVDENGNPLTGSSLETAKRLGLTEDDITSSGMMKSLAEKYEVKDSNTTYIRNGNKTYSKFKDGETRLNIYDNDNKKNYSFRILDNDEEQNVIQDIKTGNIYYKEDDGNYYGYDENNNGHAFIFRKNVATKVKKSTNNTSSSSSTSTVNNSNNSGTVSNGSNDRDTFIKTAQNTVGKHYSEIISYLGVGYADWCAYTVSYLFKKCGFIGKYVADVFGGAGDVPRYSDGKYGKFYSCWHKTGNNRPEPQAGDVILFRNNNGTAWDTASPDQYYSSHIGMIEKVEGNTIHTIEGNAGSDYVTRKTYSKDSSIINGYYRPNWVITSNSSSSSHSTVNGTQYLKDLSEAMSSWEDKYNGANNDVDGVISLGRLGYHADNALSLLQKIQNEEPDVVASKLKKYNLPSNFLSNEYVNWSNFHANDNQLNAIRDILNSNISKSIQDQKIINDARNYVKDIEDKYGIHDAGLLAMLADVRNQYGPGGLKTYWLDNMKDYTIDSYKNYLNNNGLQQQGYPDRRWDIYNKMSKYIGQKPAYKQGTAWIPDTQVALLHEGEMVIPKEKNPLNPNKFSNSEEIRKIINGKNISNSTKKETKEIIEKYANLKLIVTNFERLNSISEESLKVLKKISDNIEKIKENKNNINNDDDYSFNLNSSSLNQLLQGY